MRGDVTSGIGGQERYSKPCRMRKLHLTAAVVKDCKTLPLFCCSASVCHSDACDDLEILINKPSCLLLGNIYNNCCKLIFIVTVEA